MTGGKRVEALGVATTFFPLSRRERVRVRGFIPGASGTLTPALSRWEREL
jgi:hypothetical protein